MIISEFGPLAAKGNVHFYEQINSSFASAEHPVIYFVLPLWGKRTNFSTTKLVRIGKMTHLTFRICAVSIKRIDKGTV